MLMIEAAIRGGAVMLLLLEAALLWRGLHRALGGRFGALLAVSVAAYLVATAPGFAAPGAWWIVPIRLVSNGTPALLWLCARASFDDGFVPSPRDAIPWLGVVALAAVCLFDLAGPWAHRLLEVLQLLFIALAMREAVVGRAADLVEERRRFRLVFLTGAAIYAGVCVVLEIVTAGPPVPPWSMVNAAGIAAFVFAAILAQVMIAVRASAAPAESRPSRLQDLGRPPSLPLPIDEAESTQLARLRHLMEEERAYREEGLSIAMLSSRLDLPEYRLRRLINQRLGHRNFSSFVNGYRLAEAVAALADPSQAEVPVITIALDAGFQSLGPFNRAFKAYTGLTPTDYRRRRLGGAGAVPMGSPIPEIGEVG
jgi:AraC-like DNA-binding protein